MWGAVGVLKQSRPRLWGAPIKRKLSKRNVEMGKARTQGPFPKQPEDFQLDID